MPRILIKSATLVTMDDGVGDVHEGDLLVEGDRIAAIGKDIAAVDAEIVDGRRRIVIPGLIYAHMHTWQTALRGLSVDWTLPEYFRIHSGVCAC